MKIKKTKIVATLGPASQEKEMLKKIIEAGVNVCRLNFSHGTHEQHLKNINTIRELNSENNFHTAILADLQGPKIRVGEMELDTILIEGEKLKITTKECIGNSEKIFINYESFAKDVTEGEYILLDDGKLRLQVDSTNDIDEVLTTVVNGGKLSSRKGVNLPNTKLSLPSLTEKDRKDLEFILQHDIDWIALSFVRSASDIKELKKIIKKNNKRASVIAKIEKPEALEDIKEIIKETDAVMVARGDLGVELPMQNVPLAQKNIVKRCLKYAKPVIIATQMMESMIESITPTRAEVNDVANAVMDGADAVMLSAETSIGKYPIQVVEAMTKIIEEVSYYSAGQYVSDNEPIKKNDRFITDSICFNASRLSDQVKAKGIVTMTHSGYTAFKISSRRPKSGIFVFSSNRELLTKLSLVWGVSTFYYNKMVSTDHTIADIKYFLKKHGYVKKGDLIINTASIPIEEKGKTNMLKLSYI